MRGCVSAITCWQECLMEAGRTAQFFLGQLSF